MIALWRKALLTVAGNTLIKEPVDRQGEALATRECRWYEKAKELNINAIPYIYSTYPLKMEYIGGKNIYECQISYEEKRRILKKLIDALQQCFFL